MKIIQSEAVILRVADHGEADRLVTFYASDGGKRQGIAKGAKKSRKRFVNSLEPLSVVDLVYREARSLVWIDACKLVDPHVNLRDDLYRWCYGALFCELVLEMVPEAESQPELFTLFKNTLEQLALGRDQLDVVLLFMFRFFHLLGYLPALDRCTICQRPLMSDKYWRWDIEKGILICSNHAELQSGRLKLDLGTLVLIRQARNNALDNLWRFHFLKRCKLPLLNALLAWVHDQTRKDLKSLKMLKQLQAG